MAKETGSIGQYPVILIRVISKEDTMSWLEATR
ncbi:predicted protein [Sclerotinia sclerotiorum 1980 UF-70]|uniref:Uncharacterized protein n=1 Tax=Sclerotinia sclerotiorum (strain ATCC 18683 / 1980 / Ss-1) TaxID=665079 RepID=A7E712_SCLS1|nr:predicted protein [Sclerotinia sclerotiorum 1980 UF-70]EDN96164.1 predicted protein [Sclerotinia sclerotiorum 1980 UF-70]